MSASDKISPEQRAIFDEMVKEISETPQEEFIRICQEEEVQEALDEGLITLQKTESEPEEEEEHYEDSQVSDDELLPKPGTLELPLAAPEDVERLEQAMNQERQFAFLPNFRLDYNDQYLAELPTLKAKLHFRQAGNGGGLSHFFICWVFNEYGNQRSCTDYEPEDPHGTERQFAQAAEHWFAYYGYPKQVVKDWKGVRKLNNDWWDAYGKFTEDMIKGILTPELSVKERGEVCKRFRWHHEQFRKCLFAWCCDKDALNQLFAEAFKPFKRVASTNKGYPAVIRLPLEQWNRKQKNCWHILHEPFYWVTDPEGKFWKLGHPVILSRMVKWDLLEFPDRRSRDLFCSFYFPIRPTRTRIIEKKQDE